MGAGASINDFETLSPEQLTNQMVNALGDEYSAYKDGFIAKKLDGKAVISMTSDQQVQVLKDLGVQNEAHLNALLKEFEIIKSKTVANDISGQGPSPIVFAGPSGAGKGTVIKALMDKYPNLFGFSVSHTTRAPRPGEENGIHYNFVEKAVMEAAIANNEFIEYANVHTNFYGTSIKAVESVRSQGKICILDIDIQGVKLVKQSPLQCKYIFISPPSIEILEQRLRGRGTETEDKIQVRLGNAKGEMDYGNEPGNFDSIIINDDLGKAVEEITNLLAQWYPDHIKAIV